MIGAVLGLLATVEAAEVHTLAGPVWSRPYSTPQFFGVRLGVEFLPSPIFALSGEIALYPNLDGRYFSQTDRALVDHWNVTPDISRLAQSGAFTLCFYPINGEHDWLSTRVGGHGGFGVVHTVEDFHELGWDTFDGYAPTERELHATAVVGLSGELWARDAGVGVQLRMEQTRFVETLGGLTLELRSQRTLSLAIALNWSAGQ